MGPTCVWFDLIMIDFQTVFSFTCYTWAAVFSSVYVKNTMVFIDSEEVDNVLVSYTFDLRWWNRWNDEKITFSMDTGLAIEIARMSI